MNITKIKIKQDRVSIEYDKAVVVNEENLVNKYSIDSPEQPVGAFKDAFQKMDFFLIELCELCDKQADVVIMCEDVGITGLSFKYKDGELNSAVITGTKQLAYSNSPLVLNTPNKSINTDGDFNKMVHLTDPCIAVLKLVIEHAKEYVDGERLQIEMDLKDASEDIKDDSAKKANLGKFDSHKPEGTLKGEVSRETVKTAEVVPADEWKLHPHNPDSPNFIGDTAIQQINDYDEVDQVEESDTIPTVPDIED